MPLQTLGIHDKRRLPKRILLETEYYDVPFTCSCVFIDLPEPKGNLLTENNE